MYTNSFKSIRDAYNWALQYINDNRQIKFVLNPICEDIFKSARPKGVNKKVFELFGTTFGAEKKVRSIEPDGEWNLEIHTSCGNSYFMLWYNRFLPYAEAMVKCEDGFELYGFDYTSIFVLYKSVCGYTDLGNGVDGDVSSNDPNYNRICSKDRQIFEKIYETSMKLKPPYLPFDEAFQPCLIYLALHSPKVFGNFLPKDHYLFDHVQEVCKIIHGVNNDEDDE